MSVSFLADPVSVRHDTGPGHPERPERYGAVVEALETAGLLDGVARVESRPATRDELELVHDPAYIALAEREIASGAEHLSTGDTHICPASWDAAVHAVGGALAVVDSVLEGRADRGFCVARPPGHHARPAQGMGFCVFNNAAVAARYAQRRWGVERVLIIDWDIHHGNGTQDVFYEDGSVLFFSTHQSPWYPGTGAVNETGEGKGAGTTLNRPFPAGTGSRELLPVFEQDLERAARAFRPDLVVISAGFDARLGDPLGQFRLTDEDFHRLTTLVCALSEDVGSGKTVSLLEGGYALEGLARGAAAHFAALVGKPLGEGREP